MLYFDPDRFNHLNFTSSNKDEMKMRKICNFMGWPAAKKQCVVIGKRHDILIFVLPLGKSLISKSTKMCSGLHIPMTSSHLLNELELFTIRRERPPCTGFTGEVRLAARPRSAAKQPVRKEAEDAVSRTFQPWIH